MVTIYSVETCFSGGPWTIDEWTDTWQDARRARRDLMRVYYWSYNVRTVRHEFEPTPWNITQLLERERTRSVRLPTASGSLSPSEALPKVPANGSA